MSTRRTALAVGAAYAAQGFGSAVVFTGLPSFQKQWHLTDLVTSCVLLGACLAAAGGSLLADAIAVRRGSRTAVVVGFVIEAVGVTTALLAPAAPVFVAAMVVFGLGLGTIDASSNMQGVLLEARRGRPVLGRLYAVFTAFAILGALAQSASLTALGVGAAALGAAAVIQLAAGVGGRAALDPAAAARDTRESDAPRPPLPRAAVWAVAIVLMLAYVLDSSVSTWSSVYLAHGLAAAAAVAPLGYAAYQAAVLVSRLATDALERRLGRIRLALIAIGVGVIGTVLIAVLPVVGGAIAGFAVAGLATGALIPLVFSAAGRLLPARADEIIARVNLANYAGVVFGAVLLGLVAEGRGLGPAFLIPGLALLVAIPLLSALELGAKAISGLRRRARSARASADARPGRRL